MREEIGLSGKFKGVTKITQYSTASGDTHLREEIGLSGKLEWERKVSGKSTDSGGRHCREKIKRRER